MGSSIIYEGRDLGSINNVENGEGESELVVICTGPELAAILMNLKDSEIIDSGNVSMRVGQFGERYLSRVKRVYSSERDYEREHIGGLETNKG